MKNILYTPGSRHPAGQNRIELSYIKINSNVYPTEEVINYELFQINNEYGNDSYAVKAFVDYVNSEAQDGYMVYWPDTSPMFYKVFQTLEGAVYAVENYLTAHNVPYPTTTVVCKVWKRLCDEKCL